MDTLPHELVESISLILDPVSLSLLSRLSRKYNAIVETSFAIWRSQYLNIFDDPLPALAYYLHASDNENYDWKGHLKRRVRAETLFSDIILLKLRPHEKCQVYRTLIDVARTASPHSLGESKNIMWLRRIYDSEYILHHEMGLSSEEEDLRSQLHVLIGVTKLDLYHAEARYISRKYVYDLRHYTDSTMYGPYLESEDTEIALVASTHLVVGANGVPAVPQNSSDDGVGETNNAVLDIRANWIHLHHIHRVFMLNYIERTTGLAGVDISAKQSLQEDQNRPMNISHIRPDSAPVNLIGIGYGVDKDWPGIEGNWECSFCFCDHRDLIHFNAYVTNTVPSLNNPFLNQDFGEALRSISVNFRVLAIGSVSSSYPYPTRPPIHFEGRIVLDEGNGGEPTELDASMIGTVSMTKDNEIRWQFTSGEHGHVVWSSEGIQIGGLRSQYGVLGCWTTVFHDNSDPVGPFWLRKKSGRSK